MASKSTGGELPGSLLWSGGSLGHYVLLNTTSLGYMKPYSIHKKVLRKFGLPFQNDRLFSSRLHVICCTKRMLFMVLITAGAGRTTAGMPQQPHDHDSRDEPVAMAAVAAQTEAIASADTSSTSYCIGRRSQAGLPCAGCCP